MKKALAIALLGLASPALVVADGVRAAVRVVNVRVQYHGNGRVAEYDTLPFGPRLQYDQNGTLRNYSCIGNGFVYGENYTFDASGKVAVEFNFTSPSEIEFDF